MNSSIFGVFVMMWSLMWCYKISKEINNVSIIAKGSLLGFVAIFVGGLIYFVKQIIVKFGA
jgi:hypothetical protein